MSVPSVSANSPTDSIGNSLASIGILEDNDDLRETLSDLLGSQGYRIMASYCADELDELLSSQTVDLLLLDINLPGENGLSVARRYRKAFPDIKVIMMTTRVRVEDRVLGYDSGADLYLPKPFDLDELLAAVRALARKSVRMQEDQYIAHLNVQALQLTGPCGSVNLNPIEVKIIKSLSVAPDQALEYWQLIELMGTEDRELDKNAVFVQLNRLREKLRRAGMPDETIKSLRLHGYRLTTPVRIHSGS